MSCSLLWRLYISCRLSKFTSDLCFFFLSKFLLCFNLRQSFLLVEECLFANFFILSLLFSHSTFFTINPILLFSRCSFLLLTGYSFYPLLFFSLDSFLLINDPLFFSLFCPFFFKLFHTYLTHSSPLSFPRFTPCYFFLAMQGIKLFILLKVAFLRPCLFFELDFLYSRLCSLANLRCLSAQAAS